MMTGFPCMERLSKTPCFCFPGLVSPSFMNHIDADRALSSNHPRARRLVFIEGVEPAGTRCVTLETPCQQTYMQWFVSAWNVFKDACLFDIFTLLSGLKFNTLLN